MDLSTIDSVLWAASLIGYVALFLVLIYRGARRQFPVFTAYVGFHALSTITLYVLYGHASRHLYAVAYWSEDVIDFCLQVALVVEIARIVLRPTGTWVKDARRKFLLWGALGGLLALALAWAAQPPAATSLDAWEIRGSLFTSMLICELFTVMIFTSQQLGLGWRNHVMALAQGWATWALIAFGVDIAHNYLGAQRAFAPLEHLEMLGYLGALVYWIVMFWLPEPVRKPLSPELRQYLIELHERMHYDLSSAVRVKRN